MAKRRDREARPSARGILDERRRLIAAGSLSVAVTVVLIFGAILRTDAPFAEMTVPVTEEVPTPGVTEEPATAEIGAISTPAPAAQPSAAAPARAQSSRRAPTGDTLGERAAADRERLLDSGGSYTVQLMVSCDPDNARRVLGLIGGTSRLHVLPVELDGNACYRLCWGSYSTRENAENATDIPTSFESPRVRAIGELTS
jgi:septal ring-binding cell division protein DamX